MDAHSDAGSEPAHIVVGRLGRPHGISGTVHARATGPTLSRLALGQEVWVRQGDGPELRHVLAARGGTVERPLLGFEGVHARDAAAALTGATIAVEAGLVAGLDDPDTFYVRDLLGCILWLGERELGPVGEVHAAPANDALEVVTPDGPVLIPFTADAVVSLDLQARRIVVRPDLLG